jgi:Enoyl-CoA hydratase/isomerase
MDVCWSLFASLLDQSRCGARAVWIDCTQGAVDLITACDMRFCSECARFSVKEVEVGLCADVGEPLPLFNPCGCIIWRPCVCAHVHACKSLCASWHCWHNPNRLGSRPRRCWASAPQLTLASRQYRCFCAATVALLLHPASTGTLQRLPRVVGNQSWVRDLCYTARTVRAPEALSFGLVSHVCAGGRDGVLAHAMEVARAIAAHSPLAVTGTKRSLNYSQDHR